MFDDARDYFDVVTMMIYCRLLVALYRPSTKNEKFSSSKQKELFGDWKGPLVPLEKSPNSFSHELASGLVRLITVKYGRKSSTYVSRFLDTPVSWFFGS